MSVVLLKSSLTGQLVIPDHTLVDWVAKDVADRSVIAGDRMAVAKYGMKTYFDNLH